MGVLSLPMLRLHQKRNLTGMILLQNMTMLTDTKDKLKYQWLFRKNGFQVANEAYLVYYNALKDEPFFNQILKFKLYLVRLECDDSWVEKKLLKLLTYLNLMNFPNFK